MPTSKFLAAAVDIGTALSPDHIAFRRLVEDIRQFERPGHRPDTEGDCALACLLNEMGDLKGRAWAAEAHTQGDLVLLAQLLLFDLEHSGGPCACCDCQPVSYTHLTLPTILRV